MILNKYLKAITLLLLISSISCEYLSIKDTNNQKESSKQTIILKYNGVYNTGKISLKEFQEFDLTSLLELNESNIKPSDLIWETKSKNIQIDDNGILIALKEGFAIVTVSLKNNHSVFKNIEINIKRNDLLSSISIKPNKVDLKVGERHKLIAEVVTKDNQISSNVIWSSSDNTIATVNSDGIVTALKEGKVTILATYSIDKNYKATSVINVSNNTSKNTSDINNKLVNNDEKENTNSNINNSNNVIKSEIFIEKKLSGTNKRLLDIKFFNSSEGLIVGDETILKTLDNGNNWKKIDFNLENIFLKAIEIKENFCWVVGYQNTSQKQIPIILFSKDKGNSWEKQNLPDVLDTPSINNIFFIDKNTGWAISFSKILYTQDGGSNWSIINEDLRGINNFREKIFFWDKDYGIYSAGNTYSYSIFITNSGGKDWQNVLNLKGGLTDFFVYENNIFALSYDRGIFYKSNDKGLNWENLNSYYYSYNCDGTIFFLDDKKGFISCGNGIFKTENSGEKFNQIVYEIKDGINKIYFTDNKNGWILANSEIYKINIKI